MVVGVAFLFIAIGIGVIAYSVLSYIAIEIKSRNQKRELKKFEERVNTEETLDRELAKAPNDPELLALKDSLERSKEERDTRARRKKIKRISRGIDRYLD